VSGLLVQQPGVLSLMQDGGRFGHHRIGLSNGGALDDEAMYWANTLLGNAPGATVVEVSFGGLTLLSQQQTRIAITGGDLPLTINGEPAASWRSHAIAAGDRIELGYATHFCRAYLAAAGGFTVPPQFDSTATVVREGIGGLCGDKLSPGDLLPCRADQGRQCLALPAQEIPAYDTTITVRVIPGYQAEQFDRLQQRRFFGGHYTVTDRADRMGYRLEGPAIECRLHRMMSEGICQGAIQIPADGQPIVLLKDRQTIGGYPKIGSALSVDTARLSQLMPGASVGFEPVSPYEAHNILLLREKRRSRTRLVPA
jgi:biotin-dependent carboxylase-like uncharacterized protein